MVPSRSRNPVALVVATLVAGLVALGSPSIAQTRAARGPTSEAPLGTLASVTSAMQVTRAASTRAEEPAARPRDPCAEVLHAVRFDDLAGAERSYGQCRARVAAAGRVPVAEDLRVLEDVTEALHGLRRADGTFCVAPAAPFELSSLVGSARDTRACFASLDRALHSDDALRRFLLEDPYSAGRLAVRGGIDVTAARRSRRRTVEAPAAEHEMLSLARLVGRHMMRVCRCLPGPQPENAGAVRAMRLPVSVEAVLLRGLAERGDTDEGS